MNKLTYFVFTILQLYIAWATRFSTAAVIVFNVLSVVCFFIIFIAAIFGPENHRPKRTVPALIDYCVDIICIILALSSDSTFIFIGVVAIFFSCVFSSVFYKN